MHDGDLCTLRAEIAENSLLDLTPPTLAHAAPLARDYLILDGMKMRRILVFARLREDCKQAELIST